MTTFGWSAQMTGSGSCLRRTTLGLAMLLATLSQASSPFDHPQDQDVIAQRMDQFVSARDFSGVVLVAPDGRVYFQKAYGLANREHDVPNKLETKFRLGSTTKQFTAMAIMILAERGKLRLRDSICSYIDNCPKTWAGITVRHLLTHTSGIPNFTDFSDNDRYERLSMTPLETIARFQDKPLEFVPGERFSYDDSGYLLLGSLLSQLDGGPTRRC